MLNILDVKPSYLTLHDLNLSVQFQLPHTLAPILEREVRLSEVSQDRLLDVIMMYTSVIMRGTERRMNTRAGHVINVEVRVLTPKGDQPSFEVVVGKERNAICCPAVRRNN